MKKLLLIGLIFLSIIITGCGKVNDSRIKTIKFSSWGSQSELIVLKKVIEEFETENPDIKIDFIHIPQNYFQKLHLLFASNLAPDVVFINNIYAPIYIKAGLLENLNPYFQDEFKSKIFYENTVKSFYSNGANYAIPRDVSNLVIYYNKDIFIKKKIPFPKKNWTINDFLKTAQKLSDNKTFAINVEPISLYWLYYLESNGGGILSDDSKKIIIDSKNSIEALQFYSDLVNKYKVAPTKAQISARTGAQMFMQGDIAMYLSGRWMVPKFRETLNFDWDIINFPVSNKSKVLVDSSGWAISKNSKNKNEAVRFIKFLSSKKTIEKFTESGLIIPARLDVANSECFLSKKQKPKNSQIFLETINDSKPTPTNENYQEINDILTETLEPLFNGTQKADTLIDKSLIKKLNNLL